MFHKLLSIINHRSLIIDHKSQRGSITLVLSAMILIGSLIGSVALSPITNFDTRQQAYEDGSDGTSQNCPANRCNPGQTSCSGGKYYECIMFSRNCSPSGVWQYKSSTCPNVSTPTANDQAQQNPNSTTVTPPPNQATPNQNLVNLICFTKSNSCTNSITLSNKPKTSNCETYNNFKTKASCLTSLNPPSVITQPVVDPNQTPTTSTNARLADNNCGQAYSPPNEIVTRGLCDYRGPYIPERPNQNLQICAKADGFSYNSFTSLKEGEHCELTPSASARRNTLANNEQSCGNITHNSYFCSTSNECSLCNNGTPQTADRNNCSNLPCRPIVETNEPVVPETSEQFSDCGFAKHSEYACLTTANCVRCWNGTTQENQNRSLCPVTQGCYQPSSAPTNTTSTTPTTEVKQCYMREYCNSAVPITVNVGQSCNARFSNYFDTKSACDAATASPTPAVYYYGVSSCSSIGRETATSCTQSSGGSCCGAKITTPSQAPTNSRCTTPFQPLNICDDQGRAITCNDRLQEVAISCNSSRTCQAGKCVPRGAAQTTTEPETPEIVDDNLNASDAPHSRTPQNTNRCNGDVNVNGTCIANCSEIDGIDINNYISTTQASAPNSTPFCAIASNGGYQVYHECNAGFIKQNNSCVSNNNQDQSTQQVETCPAGASLMHGLTISEIQNLGGIPCLTSEGQAYRCPVIGSTFNPNTKTCDQAESDSCPAGQFQTVDGCKPANLLCRMDHLTQSPDLDNVRLCYRNTGELDNDCEPGFKEVVTNTEACIPMTFLERAQETATQIIQTGVKILTNPRNGNETLENEDESASDTQTTTPAICNIPFINGLCGFLGIGNQQNTSDSDTENKTQEATAPVFLGYTNRDVARDTDTGHDTNRCYPERLSDQGLKCAVATDGVTEAVFECNSVDGENRWVKIADSCDRIQNLIDNEETSDGLEQCPTGQLSSNTGTSSTGGGQPNCYRACTQSADEIIISSGLAVTIPNSFSCVLEGRRGVQTQCDPQYRKEGNTCVTNIATTQEKPTSIQCQQEGGTYNSNTQECTFAETTNSSSLRECTNNSDHRDDLSSMTYTENGESTPAHSTPICSVGGLTYYRCNQFYKLSDDHMSCRANLLGSIADSATNLASSWLNNITNNQEDDTAPETLEEVTNPDEPNNSLICNWTGLFCPGNNQNNDSEETETANTSVATTPNGANCFSPSYENCARPRQVSEPTCDNTKGNYLKQTECSTAKQAVCWYYKTGDEQNPNANCVAGITSEDCNQANIFRFSDQNTCNHDLSGAQGNYESSGVNSGNQQPICWFFQNNAYSRTPSCFPSYTQQQCNVTGYTTFAGTEEALCNTTLESRKDSVSNTQNLPACTNVRGGIFTSTSQTLNRPDLSEECFNAEAEDRYAQGGLDAISFHCIKNAHNNNNNGCSCDDGYRKVGNKCLSNSLANTISNAISNVLNSSNQDPSETPVSLKTCVLGTSDINDKNRVTTQQAGIVPAHASPVCQISTVFIYYSCNPLYTPINNTCVSIFSGEAITSGLSTIVSNLRRCDSNQDLIISTERPENAHSCNIDTSDPDLDAPTLGPNQKAYECNSNAHKVGNTCVLNENTTEETTKPFYCSIPLIGLLCGNNQDNDNQTTDSDNNASEQSAEVNNTQTQTIILNCAKNGQDSQAISGYGNRAHPDFAEPTVSYVCDHLRTNRSGSGCTPGERVGVTGQNVFFCDDERLSELTPDEVTALIEHEEAHILLQESEGRALFENCTEAGVPIDDQTPGITSYTQVSCIGVAELGAQLVSYEELGDDYVFVLNDINGNPVANDATTREAIDHLIEQCSSDEETVVSALLGNPESYAQLEESGCIPSQIVSDRQRSNIDCNLIPNDDTPDCSITEGSDTLQTVDEIYEQEMSAINGENDLMDNTQDEVDTQ